VFLWNVDRLRLVVEKVAQPVRVSAAHALLTQVPEIIIIDPGFDEPVVHTLVRLQPVMAHEEVHLAHGVCVISIPPFPLKECHDRE
jgi:hypothetical protein